MFSGGCSLFMEGNEVQVLNSINLYEKATCKGFPDLKVDKTNTKSRIIEDLIDDIKIKCDPSFAIGNINPISGGGGLNLPEINYNCVKIPSLTSSCSEKTTNYDNGEGYDLPTMGPITCASDEVLTSIESDLKNKNLKYTCCKLDKLRCNS